MPGREEHGISELTSSSSQHYVLFTPPNYVLTYEAKQFLYYLTNDLPPSEIGNIFWQTSINDQRPKLSMGINGIVIVGLIDTGNL